MQRGAIAATVASLVVAAACSVTSGPSADEATGPDPTPPSSPASPVPPAAPDEPASPTPSPTPTSTPTPTPDDDGAQAAALVSSMSDEELAGQLLVVSVHGGTAEDVTPAQATANRRLFGADTPAAVVTALQPGGVILMGPDPRDPTAGGPGNVAEPTQVPAFVDGLQAVAPVPLLVAIDQEHGPVVRLGEPFTRFPSAMALGAVGDPDLARRVAAAAATELATAGITVNLAPVADVNTEPANPVIGRRSTGQDPDRSSILITAMVAGIQQDAGIAATVKHFPGHGNTTVDSHDALPTVTTGMEQLRVGALAPFRAAIDAGVELVMPGHLLLPAIDPDHPATLSPRLLGDLLRGELGFDGVVVSDSLRMGAIQSGDGPATAVAALAAGIDLVLLPPDPVGTRDAIVAALADGTLDRGRVEAAAERVLRLKHRLGLMEGRPAPDLPGDDLLAAHDDLAVQVGARAVTVLDGVCPPPLGPATPVRVLGDDAARVAELLAAADVPVSSDGDLRLVVWDGQGDAPAGSDAVVVVTGSPYAAGRVAEHRSLLATYGDTDAALRGLVVALRRGAFDATTPVTIPRSDGTDIPLGSGIDCP